MEEVRSPRSSRDENIQGINMAPKSAAKTNIKSWQAYVSEVSDLVAAYGKVREAKYSKVI